MLSVRSSVVISSRFRAIKNEAERRQRSDQRIELLAGPGTLGSGASRIDAFVARLIAAMLSRSARAFFASRRSLCARTSRCDSSAFRLLRSIRFSVLSRSSINFSALTGLDSPEDATTGRLAVALLTTVFRSAVLLGRGAGVGAGTPSGASASPGVLRDAGPEVSRVTMLFPDPALPSAREAAYAACRACFEACNAFCDASAAVSDACDAFSAAICASLEDFRLVPGGPVVALEVGADAAAALGAGAGLSEGVALEDELKNCPTPEVEPAHPEKKIVGVEKRIKSSHEACRKGALGSAGN